MDKKERTGKPALMKELNISLILDTLQRMQKASRVELSAATGISQPTVNLLIRQLEEEGIVQKEDVLSSTGGRKAEIYALNPKHSSILSIVVQRNGFEYVITDLELKEEIHRTKLYNSQMTYLEQLCTLIKQLCQQNKQIRAAVIGVPGAVHEDGEVFAIPEIPEWEHLNLKQKLEETLSFSIAVANDINAIALGYAAASAVACSNMVYLHLGSNAIGAGIIINGKLYSGSSSFAGEVGFMQTHSPYDAQGRIQSLERILTGLICILNPEKIIIGGDNDTPAFHSRIINGAVNFLPAEILPQFEQIESGMEYYLKGLGKMGLDALDEKIRLA